MSSEDHMNKSIFKTTLLILTISLLSGCAAKIETVRGDAPTTEQLESTVVSGWNQPTHMREFEPTNITVASLPINQVNAVDDPKPITDSSGRCPTGTTPFLTTTEGKELLSKTVRVSGYGAPPARILSPMQKRLLSLRAAKLDAIRALGEIVSGMKIWGGSTLSDLALHSDKVHVHLDSFVQGAKILSTNRMEDGSYEAVVGISFNSQIVNKLELNRCVPDANPKNMRINNLPLALN